MRLTIVSERTDHDANADQEPKARATAPRCMRATACAASLRLRLEAAVKPSHARSADAPLTCRILEPALRIVCSVRRRFFRSSSSAHRSSSTCIAASALSAGAAPSGPERVETNWSLRSTAGKASSGSDATSRTWGGGGASGSSGGSGLPPRPERSRSTRRTSDCVSLQRHETLA